MLARRQKTYEEGARAVQRRQGREAVGVGLGHEVLEEGVQVREGRVHGHLTKKNKTETKHASKRSAKSEQREQRRESRSQIPGVKIRGGGGDQQAGFARGDR